MKMYCANCGSENIQKLSLVHESGTSTISATTVGAGVGGSGFGAGGAATKGTQTTAISRRVAPPQRVHPLGIAILLGLPWLIGAAIFQLPWLMFFVVWAVLIGLGYIAEKQEGQTFPAQFESWSRKYLCWRCGETMEPKT